MKSRNSRYWDMVRISNDETEYPTNMGKTWTNEEEILLTRELADNIDINTIAQTHNRTIGGIEARRREIAYKMHLQNFSYEDIMKKTKLNYDIIQQTIEKRQKNTKIKKENDNLLIAINKNDLSLLQNDVKKIKIDICEMKTTMKTLIESQRELSEMLKAIYIFENES